MKILYKLTTRERPELALRAIKSVVELSKSDNFKFLISIDEDDTSDYSQMINYLDHYEGLVGLDYKIRKGKSLGKIGSINRDMEHSGHWDILVNLSDDQVFVMDGFDEIIRDAFIDYSITFNSNGGRKFETHNIDQFIHFPDGNHKVLATMSIMGRTYYERDKYIYHPSYDSVYADNEAQDVAIMRDCYKFVDLEIFNHLHPAFGKAQNDNSYLKNEHPAVHAKDHATYQLRKANNFKD